MEDLILKADLSLAAIFFASLFEILISAVVARLYSDDSSLESPSIASVHILTGNSLKLSEDNFTDPESPKLLCIQK